MKKFYFLVCLMYVFTMQAQQPIEKIIPYADLISTSAPTQNPIFKVSDLKNNDFIIKITGVAKKSDMVKFDVFIGGTLMDKVNQLQRVFENNTYKMYLTTPLLSMSANGAVTIKNNKKNNEIRYTFDVDVTKDNTEAKKVNNTKTNECVENDFQIEADKEFINHILPKYKKDYGIKQKDNLFLDRNNTVHLFIDHFGKYYGCARPTTATEKYTYQIHLITSKCQSNNYLYSFDFTGNYNPQFNIQNGDNVNAQSASETKIIVIDFANFGPFTEQFTYDLKKQSLTTLNNIETIVHAEITVPKLYHVSITTGLIATSLRNPKNIEIAPLNETQNTLIADDPNMRGLLTIMAIYYPKGRSFLYPPSGGIFDPSRMGIVVGTQLGNDANENFLLGLSHDFARGGAITYGLHFGRREYIPGMKHFSYGEDVYTLPEVTTKKEWAVGVFFGVTIDVRVAVELLKSLTSQQP